MRTNPIRKKPEYKLWRAKIYARDKWCCQLCSSKERIEAHHILTLKKYPEKALDLDNGITLCFKCHRTIFGKEELFATTFKALIENGVNSVETLTMLVSKDNTEPSFGGNSEEGVTTRRRVFILEQFINKQVKCKVCKKDLIRHYYRWKKSKIFLCGNKCRSEWKRTFTGEKNYSYKPALKQKCQWCGKQTTTPSDKRRVKKFCNNSCQMKSSHKKGRNINILKGRWTKKHNSCTKCKSSESKHYGKGLCMTCYNKNYREKDSNSPTSALPVKG